MSKKNFRLGPKAVHFAWRVLLREDPDFGFYRRAEGKCWLVSVAAVYDRRGE